MIQVYHNMGLIFIILATITQLLRTCGHLRWMLSVYILRLQKSLSPYHMWHRHGLWGHGRRAPLCGWHGLILPVLTTSQLLLPRLAPLHLRPGEGPAQRQDKHKISIGVFCIFTCSAWGRHIKQVNVGIHYLITLSVVMFIWQNVWQRICFVSK